MSGAECAGYGCRDVLTLEIGAALSIASVLLVFLPFFASHLSTRPEDLTSGQIRWLGRVLWFYHGAKEPALEDDAEFVLAYSTNSILQIEDAVDDLQRPFGRERWY